MNEENKQLSVEINIYIDGNGGTILAYTINADTIEQLNMKAREHCQQIVMNGYRSSRNDGILEVFPPHRIFKVKAVANTINALTTNYPDKIKST